MDRMIFFHMNQLGDLLFSLPVLKAAKEESGAKIISVVKPSLAPLLTSSGLVDEIIPKEKALLGLVKNLKKENAGKAVLFSESPSSVFAAYFSGIKERVGFASASLSFLLTKKAKKTGVPSLFNNRELGIVSGFKNIKSDYTDILNIPQESVANVKEWFVENKIEPAKTIAVSTGASKKRRHKCLSVSVWVDVINGLHDLGYNCVLTGAPWEKESLDEIAQKCSVKPALFTAENGILESAAFFSLCSLFIGIDSGAMHLAAALKRKCIGIFVETDPRQIGPMPLENHIIIEKNSSSEVLPSEIIEASVEYYNSI